MILDIDSDGPVGRYICPFGIEFRLLRDLCELFSINIISEMKDLFAGFSILEFRGIGLIYGAPDIECECFIIN